MFVYFLEYGMLEKHFICFEKGDQSSNQSIGSAHINYIILDTIIILVGWEVESKSH